MSGGSVSSWRTPKKDSSSSCFICISAGLEVLRLPGSLPCDHVRFLEIKIIYQKENQGNARICTLLDRSWDRLPESPSSVVS